MTSKSPAANRPLDARGFTLLEVMVALAVIAFAFVALLGLHGRNVALVARADRYSQATLIARDLMTTLQFEDFDSINDAGGPLEWYPGFFYQREVTDTQSAEGALPIKKVILRVYWDPKNPTACEIWYFIRPNV